MFVGLGDSKETRDRPLDRYVAVLEAVAPFADGLSAAEVEAVLQLPKTTVNRLLKTLQEANLVGVSSTKSRNYVLGKRLLRLVHTSQDSDWVVAATQKILQSLAEKTGQTCFIAKLSGQDVKSVSTEAPDTPVRTYVVPGKTMPPNASASAKAILAHQDVETMLHFLNRPLEKFTANTKTDVSLLSDELAEVRARGYALDLAEHVDGLATIAAPIQTEGIGVVYAVGITGPYERIVGDDYFAFNLKQLRSTAEKLEKAIQPIALSAR